MHFIEHHCTLRILKSALYVLKRAAVWWSNQMAELQVLVFVMYFWHLLFHLLKRSKTSLQKTKNNIFFDCELRSIAVLRMTLLLLLAISISQILINNRPFRGWINNLIFL